jgi:hypothetical protein
MTLRANNAVTTRTSKVKVHALHETAGTFLFCEEHIQSANVCRRQLLLFNKHAVPGLIQDSHHARIRTCRYSVTTISDIGNGFEMIPYFAAASIVGTIAAGSNVSVNSLRCIFSTVARGSLV